MKRNENVLPISLESLSKASRSQGLKNSFSPLSQLTYIDRKGDFLEAS